MEPMPQPFAAPSRAAVSAIAAAGSIAAVVRADGGGGARVLRFEVRAVAGERTPLQWAGPAELERLRARAAQLAELLAEAAELARRGLPIALEEDEAFALAILAGDPALVRELLGRP
jgi:hypothetical protein